LLPRLLAWSCPAWTLLLRHRNARYAIDSLKQLSVKFMDKKENRGFHFQEAFMQPFERIMLKSKINSNRELILYVRVGWRAEAR
jgi:Sec7-like guanine-nucleotide exchange factor